VSVRERDMLAAVPLLIPCDCGYVAFGDTPDELLADIKAHLADRHPQEVDQHSDEDLLGMAEQVA
jgi:predicted small metal-binding protein